MCCFPNYTPPHPFMFSCKVLQHSRLLRDLGWLSNIGGHLYLESDVIKLAAVADGRSAGMDYTIHLNDARASSRRFPGPFPGGAARGRAAGRCFAFDCLLARHVSRFYSLFVSLKKKTILNRHKQTKSKSNRNLRKVGLKSWSSEEVKSGDFFSPVR